MFTQNYFEDRVAQGSPVIEKSDKYILSQVGNTQYSGTF